MKFVSLITLLLLTTTLAAKVKSYAPEGSPTRAIQELDDMLDSYILRPKTDEDRAFNANLKKKVLHGTFDIAELCRLALDRHWTTLSRKEREHFIDLMTRLLEKKAIFSKEQGGGGKKGTKSHYYLSYEGDRFLNPEKSVGIALTFVHIPSEQLKIGLNYKVKSIGGLWKIFDVIVDEASLVENYKYQFDSIIRQHGYPDLIRRMDSKLKELEEKEGIIRPAEPPQWGEPPPPPPAKGIGGCSRTAS